MNFYQITETPEKLTVMEISQIAIADSMRTDVSDGRIISTVNQTEGKNDD